MRLVTVTLCHSKALGDGYVTPLLRAMSYERPGRIVLELVFPIN